MTWASQGFGVSSLEAWARLPFRAIGALVLICLMLAMMMEREMVWTSLRGES